MFNHFVDSAQMPIKLGRNYKCSESFSLVALNLYNLACLLRFAFWKKMIKHEG